MEFDWTTFALEIINFLVLVWILQRLLYKPVTSAIAERQAGIEKTLTDAQAVRTQAEALKRQYESRMADWEHEKAQARVQLLQEIDAERTRSMTSLHASVEQEREKLRALEQRRAAEMRRRLEENALAEGGRFVARLLARLASPELEERIRELLLEDLPRLADRELQSLRTACQGGEAKMNITSGYPLGEGQRASLTQALSRVMGQPLTCEFGHDPELMAGFRIGIGPWVLRSNLRDELKFFAEAEHAGL
ncbi:MAG: F0F1 ATP synthase subunit delta [Burkholderiales bacterium]|nr:F0F1 ATP synthase subunit delta [Burkholderiales bacterium]